MGLVRSSHTGTPPAPGEQGQRNLTACPKDGQFGEGECLTLDAPHHGTRSAPRQPPATPAARNVRQGMQAKGPVPGPHARTPAPTACGQRTPTACPKDGQPGEGERLTPDAPHKGTRHPPPETPSCHPRNAQRQLARVCVVGLVRSSHTRTPPPRPKNRGSGT